MSVITLKTRCVLYFLVCLHVMLLVTSKKYAVRPGSKLLSTKVIDDLRVSSKMECVASCESRSDCRSASWGSSPQLCLLASIDVVIDWRLIDIHPGLEADAEWMTYGKIHYGVSVFRRVFYNLTFDEARQVCEDQSTELATEEQILDARATGLHFCRCGWFAEGTKGFVLQYPELCTSNYNTRIIYCASPLVDAWCVMH